MREKTLAELEEELRRLHESEIAVQNKIEQLKETAKSKNRSRNIPLLKKKYQKLTKELDKYLKTLKSEAKLELVIKVAAQRANINPDNIMWNHAETEDLLKMELSIKVKQSPANDSFAKEIKMLLNELAEEADMQEGIQDVYWNQLDVDPKIDGFLHKMAEMQNELNSCSSKFKDLKE